MRGSATREVKGADLKMEHEFRLLRKRYRQKIDAPIPNRNCGSTTGTIEIGKLGRVTVIPLLFGSALRFPGRRALMGSGQQRFSFGESETRSTVFPCRTMITTPSPHPAGSSSGGGGEKIWSWTLWVWNPCNPLKSHKTAKGIFGNPWTETA